MTLDELLAMVKDIPDETEFELAGKKVKAGDLKQITSAQKTAAEKAMKDAETARTRAIADAEQAAKILADLDAASKAQPKSEPTDTDDFDTNNWWTPVRKRLEPMTKAQKELKDAVDNLTKVFGNAATMWAEDRWRNQYERGSERLTKSEKHKAMSYDDVKKYAVDNRLLDNYGFPSIEKAIADLTKEDELAAAVRQAREEGMKEGMTRARLNATPRPTSASGKTARPEKGLDPTKNFEDLGDTIADDKELAEMLAQVQGISPDDLVQ